MKLQFKHQKFQADAANAANAVCDVFAGQHYLTPTYMMDKGSGTYQIGIDGDKNFTGRSILRKNTERRFVSLSTTFAANDTT